MHPEPIPANCLPSDDALRQLLRGPKLDEQGRIKDGTYQGMTPAEVLAQRERYRQIVGE